MSFKFRPALAATLALAIAASAAVQAKTNAVRVPASLIKDPASRLCMPRGMSATVGKDKSQPATLCLTVDEWATHGVTVTTK